MHFVHVHGGETDILSYGRNFRRSKDISARELTRPDSPSLPHIAPVVTDAGPDWTKSGRSSATAGRSESQTVLHADVDQESHRRAHTGHRVTGGGRVGGNAVADPTPAASTSLWPLSRRPFKFLVERGLCCSCPDQAPASWPPAHSAPLEARIRRAGRTNSRGGLSRMPCARSCSTLPEQAGGNWGEASGGCRGRACGRTGSRELAELVTGWAAR